MAFGPADGFSSLLPQEFCIVSQKVPMLLPLQIRAPFWFSAFHKVNGYVQQWQGWDPRLWVHSQDQDGASHHMLARHELTPPQGSLQSASLNRTVFFALRFTQSRAKRNHLVGNKKHKIKKSKYIKNVTRKESSVCCNSLIQTTLTFPPHMQGNDKMQLLCISLLLWNQTLAKDFWCFTTSYHVRGKP